MSGDASLSAFFHFCRGEGSNWLLGFAIAWLIGFGIYGFVVTRGFNPAPADPPTAELSTARCARRAGYVYQAVLNAVGGFVGWIAVWFLWNVRFDDYAWKHLAAFIVAFLGITGNLPYVSNGVRDAIVGTGAAVAALVKRLSVG